MANRDYIQPKIPGDWKGAERTYAIMLQNVLDDLHLPIKEEWLAASILQKLNNITSIDDYNASQSYTTDIADTGLTWIDGSAIKRVTQEIEVTANTAADSETIDNLGTIIRIDGSVVTAAGACFPIGHASSGGEVNVWKPAGSTVFKVLSTVSGTAYITVWYVEGEVQPSTDTFVFFNDGYTDYEDGGGQIAWGANQLTRPNNPTQGYTAYGAATLEYVSTNGYMLLYNNTGANYYYNSHVCTANIIHIPSTATALKVIAARGANTCQMNIALLPNDAPDSMDISNGGAISTFFTLSTTKTEYSLAVDSSMQGTDLYRIVVNFRGKGDVYRQAQITKVYFE